LREQAPDEADRARVGDVLAELQALRSAMAAQRMQGGIGTPQAERVRELLASFGASLRALRSPGGPD
jgi:hypothetical protein